MRSAQTNRRLTGQRGATAVLVVVLVAALLGMLGLALNVGHLMSVRSELQTAADSAALAGAQQLARIVSPTTGHPDMAQIGQVTTQATTFSQYNPSDRLQLAINNGDVTVGIWNSAARTFTPSGDAALVNAVRVNVARATGAATGPVDIAFATLMGSSATKNVSASAVAEVGGRCELECNGLLPVVVNACAPSILCGQTIFLPDAGASHDFWTSFNQGNSAATLSSIIDHSICGSLSAKVGDCVDLVPGVKTSVLQTLETSPFCGSVKHGSTCSNPQPATVPVFCAGTPRCGSSGEIMGFVRVTVTQVVNTGPNKGANVSITCGVDQGNSTGSGSCGNFGSLMARPRLVQ